jgi:hypothetical protein
MGRANAGGRTSGAGQVRYSAGRRAAAGREVPAPARAHRGGVAAPLTCLPRTGVCLAGRALGGRNVKEGSHLAIHGGCSADLGRRARGLRVRCSDVRSMLSMPVSASLCGLRLEFVPRCAGR